MTSPRVISIQVGLPKRYESGSTSSRNEWYSAFDKQPVNGKRYVHFDHIDGDGQADRKNHGGPDKAVLCYAADHYRKWTRELHIDLPYGGFGENLTIEGMDETNVCVGDVLAIGGAKFQVSQMRGPCWKISARWGIPDLLDRVRASGRTGWYLRVLEKGYVESGQPVQVLERRHPDWTIERINDVCEGRLTDGNAIRDLLTVNELSAAAQNVVALRLRRMLDQA
ncbi:MOSC domain-containing protein YiiM [Alicyclobacillus sacchari]|uniref:MOSC domain-containing protein YiiM n=1 Tax=Alicyclobacillus sacchari TaxID=392010 RepID=A0A4R8LJJ6_9BACL|nr:MOSC domain-containing protein [Alicyclobacillus sacchari]TDY43981.1 MOSC domain-containing protein YiiM [Alicyclobacillus sacchari]GMA58219.1 molybdenum cofactor sulfurase [Alicyclobacillus sacchari]